MWCKPPFNFVFSRTVLIFIVSDLTLFVVVFKTGMAGLAFASSLSAIISSLVLFSLLRKRVKEINAKKISKQVKKMFYASFIMSLVIFVLWQSLSKELHTVYSLGVAIVFSAIIYILIGYLFRVYQSIKILEWILRKK